MKITLLSAASAAMLLIASSSAWAWADTPPVAPSVTTPASNATGGAAKAKAKATATTGPITINNVEPAAPSSGTNKSAHSGTGTSGHTRTAAAGSGADPSGGGGSGSSGRNGVRVPPADAPAVMSFNPCSGSPLSAGVPWFSFGTGGGFDNACRLHMIGKDRAAMAYLCRVNSDVRQAFKDIGEPCPEDAPKAVTVVVPEERPRNTQVIYSKDWCATRNAGDKNQHLECESDAKVVRVGR